MVPLGGAYDVRGLFGPSGSASMALGDTKF